MRFFSFLSITMFLVLQDLEKLRIRVRELATTPVACWQSESREEQNHLVTSPCGIVTSPSGSQATSIHPTPTPTKHNGILLSPVKHLPSSLSHVRHHHGEPCGSPVTEKQTPSPVETNSNMLQKLSLNSSSSSLQKSSVSICKKLQNTIDHPLRSLVDSTARSFTSK